MESPEEERRIWLSYNLPCARLNLHSDSSFLVKFQRILRWRASARFQAAAAIRELTISMLKSSQTQSTLSSLFESYLR
ncbi:unnamed protein product [Brassica rapa subsp. trilocularis]